MHKLIIDVKDNIRNEKIYCAVCDCLVVIEWTSTLEDDTFGIGGVNCWCGSISELDKTYLDILYDIVCNRENCVTEDGHFKVKPTKGGFVNNGF